MKRVFSCVVAASLALSLLVGCGASSTASSAASSAASSEAASSVASSAAETAALPDGVYTAEFDTDSSMFHANEACDGKGTLTVENGVPLIRGLPISNLSDGELLELCVDISVSKPGQLQIILVDGAERLDKESRDRLYAKCKEKGLQLIATRVTDSDALEVTEL